jgi:hypothetical protein
MGVADLCRYLTQRGSFLAHGKNYPILFLRQMVPGENTTGELAALQQTIPYSGR